MSNPELKTPGFALVKTIADDLLETIESIDDLISPNNCAFNVLTGGAFKDMIATPWSAIVTLTVEALAGALAVAALVVWIRAPTSSEKQYERN